LSTVEQLQDVAKTEQQQIEYSLQKKNLLKTTPVITKTEQKIFCHFCPTRTDLISKEFFYTFPNGLSVFFCNKQEKDLWVGIYKLNS